MLNIMLSIQHHFNPLHVHCRLVERGLNKKSSLSICRYYEILIYSWLAWFTIVAVRTCKLSHRRIIMKMLLVLLSTTTLVFSVAGIAMAITIEFTDVWDLTASDPLLSFCFSSLIGIAAFLTSKL
jgi:hypothetical protein